MLAGDMTTDPACLPLLCYNNLTGGAGETWESRSRSAASPPVFKAHNRNCDIQTGRRNQTIFFAYSYANIHITKLLAPFEFCNHSVITPWKIVSPTFVLEDQRKDILRLLTNNTFCSFMGPTKGCKWLLILIVKILFLL